MEELNFESWVARMVSSRFGIGLAERTATHFLK